MEATNVADIQVSFNFVCAGLYVLYLLLSSGWVRLSNRIDKGFILKHPKRGCLTLMDTLKEYFILSVYYAAWHCGSN